MRNYQQNHVQNDERNNIKITLKISYDQNTIAYKCYLKELLEKYLIEYTKRNNMDYSTIYIIYNGSSLFGDQLKKPISEIISPQNKKDRLMTLLVVKSLFTNIQEDEIIISLSIESVKVIELKGTKEEKIKDIINNSFKIDFDWCKFKYRDNEIDLEQKFDNIANDEDKNRLKIVITVNYTIPLIVYFVDEQNKKYKIQCLLGDSIYDKIKPYFNQRHFDTDDYYFVYENKKIEFFYIKKFYEIISEKKNQNSFYNDEINNTIPSLPTIENLNETDKIKIYDKEKKIIPPINEPNKRKIEIEIKIIKKCCCVRYKRKISYCCCNCFCRHMCENRCCKIIYISLFIIIFLFLIVGTFITTKRLKNITNSNI